MMNGLRAGPGGLKEWLQGGWWWKEGKSRDTREAKRNTKGEKWETQNKRPLH